MQEEKQKVQADERKTMKEQRRGELYRWQRECLASWEKHGFRGIVQAVTGAGKTRLALAAIRLLREREPQGSLQVRVVAPTVALANQWLIELTHEARTEEERPSLVGGGRHADASKAVLVYVINSARTLLAQDVKRAFALGRKVLLICDECHRYESPMNRRIFDFITPQILSERHYLSLGLSATPFGGSDDSILKRFLGQELYSYGFSDALEDDVLSRFFIYEIACDFLPDEMMAYNEISDKISLALHRLLKAYPYLKELPEKKFMQAVSRLAVAEGDDGTGPASAFRLLTFRRREITNLAKTREQCALSLLRQLHHPGRDVFPHKVLIFCERISQTESLYAAIRNIYGNICGIYHSQLNKAAKTRSLEAFRDRQISVLVSCKCLDEGLDVPDADIGIVLSSTSVQRQRIQRLGRILRKADGKAAASLYYIYIRQSSDDVAYLHGLDGDSSLPVRYYPLEDSFSNELYEYAASELLRPYRQTMSGSKLSELRLCLNEGLLRPDWLLPKNTLPELLPKVSKTHEKNYIKTMQRLSNF